MVLIREVEAETECALIIKYEGGERLGLKSDVADFITHPPMNFDVIRGRNHGWKSNQSGRFLYPNSFWTSLVKIVLSTIFDFCSRSKL